MQCGCCLHDTCVSRAGGRADGGTRLSVGRRTARHHLLRGTATRTGEAKVPGQRYPPRRGSVWHSTHWGHGAALEDAATFISFKPPDTCDITTGDCSNSPDEGWTTHQKITTEAVRERLLLEIEASPHPALTLTASITSSSLLASSCHSPIPMALTLVFGDRGSRASCRAAPSGCDERRCCSAASHRHPRVQTAA